VLTAPQAHTSERNQTLVSTANDANPRTSHDDCLALKYGCRRRAGAVNKRAMDDPTTELAFGSVGLSRYRPPSDFCSWMLAQVVRFMITKSAVAKAVPRRRSLNAFLRQSMGAWQAVCPGTL
jgi:hypothetical protein